MKRLISFLLVFLLMMSVLSPTSSAITVSQISDGGANESKWLSLSTNTVGSRYFVDSSGNPVNLWGMARCQYHGSEEDALFSDTPDVNSLTEHYRALGCNIMRLAIDCPEICKEGGGVSEEEINRFISEHIDPDVQAIIRSGMYVMLDVHMYPPEAPENVDGAEYTVDWAYDNYLPLLIALAKKYANEPMIAVIEIWNEPYAADQKELEFDLDIWQELVRQYYIDAVNEIRKYDTRHILMVSDWNAGWGCATADTWGGYQHLLDPSYRNTAHSIHIAAEHMDDNFDFYKNWYVSLAEKLNACLVFGEIETEEELMTTKGMENLISMFSETENTHHFGGVLWRPHSDQVNYVDVWKDWVKGYTNGFSANIFREIIEAENFYDISGNADLVKDSELFGAYSKATGITLSPKNQKNDYYEADLSGDKIYLPGKYQLTVTAKATESNTAGFIVGYRTVSGEIYQICEISGNSNSGEIFNKTVSFESKNSIAGIVFFSNSTEKLSVVIDRVYLSGAAENSSVDSSSVAIKDVDIIYSFDGMVYETSYSVQDSNIIYDNTVLNPNHWYSDAMNFTSTDNSVVMGHSAYTDSHYSALSNFGTVKFIESPSGNYFEITTSNGWDADLSLRYGPHADDRYSVNTSNATHIYMTVKFDAENLKLFKNAKVFSKNVIGDATDSRDSSTALAISLGADSGVTFKTWLTALEAVTPDRWVTLKLPVTSLDGCYPDESRKNYYFKFGEQLAANFCLMGVRVTSEQINPVYIEGANVLADDMSGLRFISHIDKSKLPNNVEIIDFGAIISYADAYKFGKGELYDDSIFVYNNKDYINIKDTPQARDVVINGDIISFSSSVRGISSDSYLKGFAVSAYLKYAVGGNETTVYSIPITRNVFEAAQAAADSEEEKISADFIFENIVNDVASKTEIITETDGDYSFNNLTWNPQLVIENKPLPAEGSSYIEFDIACSDIETVIDNFIPGSRSSLGGKSFTYDFKYDLGIYFNGEGVTGVGVIQLDLREALITNQYALAGGKTVTLKLPIKGSFEADAEITAINFMVSHGDSVPAIAGLPITVSNFKLIK